MQPRARSDNNKRPFKNGGRFLKVRGAEDAACAPREHTWCKSTVSLLREQREKKQGENKHQLPAFKSRTYNKKHYLLLLLYGRKTGPRNSGSNWNYYVRSRVVQ